MFTPRRWTAIIEVAKTAGVEKLKVNIHQFSKSSRLPLSYLNTPKCRWSQRWISKDRHSSCFWGITTFSYALIRNYLSLTILFISFWNWIALRDDLCAAIKHLSISLTPKNLRSSSLKPNLDLGLIEKKCMRNNSFRSFKHFLTNLDSSASRYFEKLNLKNKMIEIIGFFNHITGLNIYCVDARRLFWNKKVELTFQESRSPSKQPQHPIALPCL